jgi:hypothetical protein
LALTGLPFTIMEILAISTLLSVPSQSAEQGIKIIPIVIIWAVAAMGNLGSYPFGAWPDTIYRDFGRSQTCCRSEPRTALTLHCLGKIGEELVSQFLG